MTSSRLIEHYSAKARESTSLILDFEGVMRTVAEHKVSNDFQSTRELWKQLETKSPKSFHLFPLRDFPCAKRQGDKNGSKKQARGC
jgi:hypothetical protein